MKFNDNPLFVERVAQLNTALAAVHPDTLATDDGDSWPLVLKLGSSRSGSTVFLQWIASLGSFAYPSNFLSLFPQAPVVGARLFELITNPRYRYNHEFDDIAGAIAFDSVSGKTRGLRAPNEFWQFWLAYFDFPEVPVSDGAWLERGDFGRFNRDVRALTREFNRPFVLKAHHLGPYLEVVAPSVSNAVYLHMHRDPVDVVSSVIAARVTRYGDLDHFFGWRPREFELLRDLDIHRQVAGQVYFNERSILERHTALGHRYLSFSYETFCADPQSVHRQMVALVNRHSPEPLDAQYRGPERFAPSRCDDPAERAAIELALAYWTSEYGELRYDDPLPGAE